MLALKNVLQTHGIKQAELARAVNISPATLAQLLNKEIWPTTPAPALLKHAMTEALSAKGIAVEAAYFEPAVVDAAAGELQRPKEVMAMLIQKVSLKKPVRQHFGIFKDPFDDDVNCPDDVFLTGNEQRYAYEAMRDCWSNHGFKAIVGESGSGKTTLKDRMIDDLRHENVVVIAPKVSEMGETEKKGTVLRMKDINDAILATLTPDAKVRRTSQARQRQVHEALVNSARMGNKHLLLIEEAHDLPLPTLRHIKRLREEKDGTRLILGVLLLGQPELGARLNMNTNWDAREVIQRCEVITLEALGADLESYLRFKFKRVGKELDEVFEKGAVDAIRGRLFINENKQDISLMYPLMVNNLVAKAMQDTYELGFEKVSTDLIKRA